MKIGVDLVDVARLRRALQRAPALAPRTFSKEELRAAEAFGQDRRTEFLAGRFAAKEAVMKALGLGLADGVSFTEVECRQAPDGAAYLALSGKALAAAESQRLSEYRVSISHERALAIAFVVLA